MEENRIFKPIFWRLVLWKFFPIYIGWLLGGATSFAIRHYSSFDLLDTVIVGFAMLIISTLFSVGFQESYTIDFSKGKIDGPSRGMPGATETFDITDMNWDCLYQQSLYEKISGFHTLRSMRNQKIIITDFIYGKPAVKGLYQMLEQLHLQSGGNNVE